MNHSQIEEDQSEDCDENWSGNQSRDVSLGRDENHSLELELGRVIKNYDWQLVE